jgi:hypothetical protein
VLLGVVLGIAYMSVIVSARPMLLRYAVFLLGFLGSHFTHFAALIYQPATTNLLTTTNPLTY